ncbi:calcyon neuron-specific vesicular protein [Tachysurus ichikawai]
MECACAVPSTDAASADSGIATVTVLLRSAAPTFFFPIFHKNLPHGTTTSLPSRKIVVTKVTASFHSVDEDVARESALNVSRTKHHDAD